MKRKLLAALLIWSPFSCFGAAASEPLGYLGLETVDNRVLYTRRYSQAEAAGLLPGDEILEINAKPVKGLSRDDINRLLLGTVGGAVTISARRDKKAFVVTIASLDPLPAFDTPNDSTAEDCYKLGVKQREMGWPDQSRSSMLRAIILDHQGAIKIRAKRYMLTELPLYPVETAALNLNNRAWQLDHSDRTEEAKILMEECINRYPDFEWPRVNLASIYCKSGKLAEANKLIDYCLNKHPEYVSAWVMRSYLRQTEGDIKGALLCATKAAELDPENKQAAQRCAELKGEDKK